MKGSSSINIKQRIVFIFAFALVCSFITQGNAFAKYDLAKKRSQSASELLNQIEKFKTKAESIHVNSLQLIAQATKLKGEASQFEIKTPTVRNLPKLSAEELIAAKEQYQNDIKQFALHAKFYNAHLKQFQSLLGECHANNQALASILQKYQLHVNQFHLPMQDVKPPHICVRLQDEYGNLVPLAGRMLSDQKSIINAEQSLSHEQENLKMANAATPSLQNNAMLTAQRAKGEAQLVAEFNRLQEEYSLLEIEKKAIAGGNKGSNTSLSSVSGKVIPKQR